MSKPTPRRRPQGKGDPSSRSDARAAKPQKTHTTARGSAQPKGRAWIGGKGPVLRFVAIVSVLTLGFNALFYFWFPKWGAVDAYLGLNAQVSAAVLTLFGEAGTAVGTSLTGERYSLGIELGCDAVQPSAFFAFLVLGSPVRRSLLSRIIPILAGVLTLLVLNVVRIVSLYYVGVYIPSAFETMHVEVWQAVFILLPLLLWIIWVRHAIRAKSGPPDASR